MADFFDFHWPLNSSSLLFIAFGLIAAWFCVTQFILWIRTYSMRRRGHLLERIANEYGPIVACVTGDHEAIAVGWNHLHWIDDHDCAISFSLPWSDVTHLKIVDEDPDCMKLCFRLSSNLETRTLSTRDVLQVTELFRLIQAKEMMVDYLAR